MPRGDSTGPMVMGPMTGRAAGFCAGYNMPGFMNNAPERGSGRGFRGGGFGRRNRFRTSGVPGTARADRWAAPLAHPDSAAEKLSLKSQAEYLQSELDAIKKRLDELNA